MAIKNSSNLQSISWYLEELSKRAAESGYANAEEFHLATNSARESLDKLIYLLSEASNVSHETD